MSIGKTLSNSSEFIKKNRWIIVLFFFLTVFFVRCYFAFQVPGFSDDKAYFVLRQVENISRTGTMITHDTLSYSGRDFIAPPVFYYVLAFFNLFLPLEFVAKVIPNLFAASVLVIVYLITIKFTRNVGASLFASFISGFIPVFFLNTFNSISTYSLALPLVLSSFYTFMMLSSDERYVVPYIASIALLSFSHPSVFFVIVGEMLYLLLLKVENISYKRVEFEAILSSLFLVIWSQFLIYKEAFLIHGYSIIWQNAPQIFMEGIFAKINIFDAILQIGIVPAFFGAAMFYRATNSSKSKFITFFLAYSLPLFIFLWFRLIIPTIGLIFLSVGLILVIGKYYQEMISYIEKTKFSILKIPLIILLVIITSLTSFAPTFSGIKEELNASPSINDIKSAQWIAENTHTDDVILSTYDNSFFIQYYSKRKTVYDTEYMLIEDVNQIFEDVGRFYTSSFSIEAMKVVEKYDVDYIMISPSTKLIYGGSRPEVFSNWDCFDRVYKSLDNKNHIYEVKCSLAESDVSDVI